MTLAQKNAAFEQGFANGQADKRIGYTSKYATHCYSSEPEYLRHYSRGYKRGQAAPLQRTFEVNPKAMEAR